MNGTCDKCESLISSNTEACPFCYGFDQVAHPASNASICRQNRCGHYNAANDTCQLVIDIGKAKGQNRRGAVGWLDSHPEAACPDDPPQWAPPATAADWKRPLSHVRHVTDGAGVQLPAGATSRVSVDWIAPYGPDEIQYMADCLRSVAWQRRADIHLHLIPDSGAPRVDADLPEHVTVHWYERTDGRMDRLGAYRIGNAIAAKHTRTPWMFVVDVDDISLPNRAWESVATCERYGCEQVGGALIQWTEGEHPAIDERTIYQPRVYSGTRYSVTPHGIVANSTRCVSVDAFRRMNGFENWMTAADFEFDNRSQIRGVRTYKATSNWGLRRLRMTSVTNSPSLAGTKEVRDRHHAELLRRIKLPSQEGLGAMDQDAGLLEEV